MSADLRTTYLGLELRNPLVASSSPLTGDIRTLRALEDAGVAAVTLPSLFEEQIEHEQVDLHLLLEHGTYGFGEALTFFPELDDYNTGPGSYIDHLARAKAALRIPVIASLNGYSDGGWVRYAKLAEEAGADALELNVYHVATDPETTAADVEERTLALVRSVRAAVEIPLAVKVGPFYSAFANMATRLADAGADGLVLFNRFLQPDIDLEGLTVEPRAWLSTPEELRLPLRWISILRGRVEASLAGTSGVHSTGDALKLLLVGADVVMTASALLRRGPSAVTELLSGIQLWLDEREYVSVEQAKGSLSQIACPDPAAFERGNYMRALTSFSPSWEW